MAIRTSFLGALALSACAIQTPLSIDVDAAHGGEPAPQVISSPPVPAPAAAPAADSGRPPAPPPILPGKTPDPSRTAYPGTGFVVHEWGTNTVVVGSDGVRLAGLHHEGDDLPPFVFDRLKQGDVLGFPALDKMETPVDYFHSDVPRSVNVRVDMPRGVLTQWYPAVAGFAPPILNGTSLVPLMDPVFDVHYMYQSQQCRDKYTQLMPGTLDWGKVEILARNAAPALPDAPRDRYTWSYAREVAANPVQVHNPMGWSSAHTPLSDAQAERFLFYRGLGYFEPPLVATSLVDASGVETVRADRPVGKLWLLRIEDGRGAFSVLESRGKDGHYESALPSLQGAAGLDAFVELLAAELTAALSGTGLYSDEAEAMINTWRKQWFRTPGVRLLYFAPADWIERELPLTISPAPDSVTRVMVMRVELLTRSVEDRDLSAAINLGSSPDNASARAYFTALGRFAEPRLRRALAILGGLAAPEAQAFLTEIEGPSASWAVGE